jgi:hypothetical protein
MAEWVLYTNGEFTECLKELPLTEKQKTALEELACGPEKQGDRSINRIIVDMDY